MREAPLAGFERLRLSPKPRILFVTHEFGGGVQRHVDELAAAVARDAEVLSLSPRGGRLEIRVMADPGAALWLARDEWARLVELLRAVGIDRVHFHHVHGLPREVLALPAQLGCGHYLTLHDHFPICPQYHLLDGDARFCGGEPGCQRCLELQPAQWPVSIDEWRGLFEPILRNASHVIAPSQDSAVRMRRHFPSCMPLVWPHPQPGSVAPVRALRVIVPGAISPAKGLSLLVECARDAAARSLPLHFHVVGYVAYPVTQWPEVPLTIGGEFREGELPRLLAASGADALLFPAQVPETFSFTLSDALETGLPIVATNVGALPERLAGYGRARVVPWDAPPQFVNDTLMEFHAPTNAAAPPKVSFDEYAGRYIEGLKRGAAPAAQPLAIDAAWLEAPRVGDPSTRALGGLAWLFDDAVLCGRALSRDRLAARLRRLDPDHAAARPIDVVIPVYAGETETRACIASVLGARVQAPHEIVVINDASPEPSLSEWLRGLARERRITLIEHADNRGFVASANEGLSLHADRDVVLLNSDTEVASGWLDRLAAHVRRDAKIATVTPFTSNGTILSYPRPHVPNRLPLGETTASLDAKFAAANAGLNVEIPTAVGFCMYISRSCLDTVGVFDQARYGTGYGEEVDFCMRAARAGYRNVAAGDVFVRHVGGVSFGQAGNDRRARAQAIVDQLYPEFQPRLRDFLARDPTAPLRARVHRARSLLSRLADHLRL
jgi:GT2 family glycosyltransferase/glycosyltransferase involved in cell wall biosynthesis